MARHRGGRPSLLRRVGAQLKAFLCLFKSGGKDTGRNPGCRVEVGRGFEPRHTSFGFRHTSFGPRHTSFGPASGSAAPTSSEPKCTSDSSSSSSRHHLANLHPYPPLPPASSAGHKIKRKPVGQGRRRNSPRLGAISENGVTRPRTQGTPPARPLSLPNQNKPLPGLPPGELEHRMRPETVAAVVSWINYNLGDIPYAVAGLSGLTMHGFWHRHPVQVTIVCPRRTRDVMRCWAATKASGRRDPNDDPEKFGVELPGDPVVRTVRVRYVRDETFQALPLGTVAGGASESGGAHVLLLPALLDMLAKSYMRLHERGPRTMARARRTQAQDMVWIVDRLIETGEEVYWADVPHVLNPLFIEPFDCMHPGARDLFRLAGLVRDDDIFAGFSGIHWDGEPSPTETAGWAPPSKVRPRQGAAPMRAVHTGLLDDLRYTDYCGSESGSSSSGSSGSGSVGCLSDIHENVDDGEAPSSGILIVRN